MLPVTTLSLPLTPPDHHPQRLDDSAFWLIVSQWLLFAAAMALSATMALYGAVLVQRIVRERLPLDEASLWRRRVPSLLSLNRTRTANRRPYSGHPTPNDIANADADAIPNLGISTLGAV